jgi:hypothetical protein
MRQFVAMPLGLAYTVDASRAGAEKFGGIQVTVYEPRPGRFPEHSPIEQGVGSGRMAGARAFTKVKILGTY